MFICKINQDVKYVQFKGNPIELINGYKYTNEELIKAYPEYFVEIAEIKATKTLNEVLSPKEEVKPEPKKRGPKPKQLLVDESSDVTIEVTE